jgi:hypothetical protein
MNTCPSGKSTQRSHARERKPQSAGSILGPLPATTAVERHTVYGHGRAPGPGLHDAPPAEARFGASTRRGRERETCCLLGPAQPANTHPSIYFLDPSRSSGQLGSLRINLSLSHTRPNEFHYFFRPLHRTRSLQVPFACPNNSTTVPWSSVSEETGTGTKKQDCLHAKRNKSHYLTRSAILWRCRLAGTSKTQNRWVPGLCPPSAIINSGNHNVSETRSVSVLRWGQGDIYGSVP